MVDGLDAFGGRRAVDLTVLHHRYNRWLASALRRRFGADDSDDLLQETWLRLASASGLEAPRHPKAFLLRVALNLASSRYRKRRATHLAESGAQTPLRYEADQTDAILLTQVVVGLPEPLRDVFLLSRVDGLTNAQIGEKLGLSPKTVEWRMTRALAHCAAQLRR